MTERRQLLERLVETGKPVILILMNGRPLALEWEARHLPVILEAWFPGTMGGPALVDVLFGDRSPVGRLPVTFPRHVGQVPIFHAVKATGRPLDPARPDEKYRSRYLDTPNDPLFPFGHGLRIDHQAATAAMLASRRRRLSLVDCTSFEVMRRLGLQVAFAFDGHFVEQGFRAPDSK